MADTPITPTIQTTGATPPAQDLQINLDEAPKAEIQPETGNLEPETNLDLNLDLNLPEATKNDDRLKEEDILNSKKNEGNEFSLDDGVMPTTGENITSNKIISKVDRYIKNQEKEKTTEEVNTNSPFVPEAIMPVIPTSEETSPVVEEISTINKEPSSSIEEIPSSPEPKENIIEPNSLKEDMKIIEELQIQASSGGLDEAAKVDTTPVVEETPKTFDLDAMLGTTPIIETINPTETTSDLFTAKPENTSETIPVIETAKIAEQTTTLEATPAFTIPKETIQTPTNNQNIYTQTTQKPTQDKNKGVKILLFVVLFVVLGFITYFILRTMYPVEFGNMFGGNTVETTNETEEDMPEEMTGDLVEETTGTIEELTGNLEMIIPGAGTGDHESANNLDFGELNDLGTPTTTDPEATDISRLTDYVNKGNELREIGKEVNNNTIIKFALYTKTKATSFLEKIAKGEEISNLDSYFAQFDQYISQIEALINLPTTEEVSPLPENNATEETTTEPKAMTNEF